MNNSDMPPLVLAEDIKDINENPSLEELTAFCKQAGFDLLTESLEQLRAYLTLLNERGKETNLVGKKNWQEILNTLVFDSFYLADFLVKLQSLNLLPKNNLESWDLGAGAGLPGLPLRMLWQEGAYYLVEERKKRALFMQDFLTLSPLKDTHVFCGRAETFFKTKAKADLILSRAFMPYVKLLPLVHTQLKKNGVVIVLSNDPAPKKIEGWHLVAEQEYDMNGAKRYFWALSVWNART